jgi:tryptophan-rich sensory protein
MTTRPNNYFSLLLFVLIVAGVALSGMQFLPGEWYAQLQKPAWTPPNWVFAPVWTILYLMIAVAGWISFASSNRLIKWLWVIQLILNGLWSWLFFGLHKIGLGLAVILTMLAIIGTIVFLTYKTETSISRLMMPYLAWVTYASTLNIAIYLMNTA